MTETQYHSIHKLAQPGPRRLSLADLIEKPRVIRILRAVADRSLTTREVYAIALDPNSPKPGRERGKTWGALSMLRDAGAIVWRHDAVSICDAGRWALEQASGRGAGQ